MEIYRVDEQGRVKCETIEDCQDGYDFKNVEFDFLAYWYESGCYDGDGFAVFRKKTNAGFRWFGKDLSHCSCYGPFDGASALLCGSGSDVIPEIPECEYLDADGKRARALREFVLSTAKDRGWI